MINKKDTITCKTQKLFYNSQRKDIKTRTSRRTRFIWTNKKVSNRLALQLEVQKVSILSLGAKFYNF
jgi:translation initiation factor IF-3